MSGPVVRRRASRVAEVDPGARGSVRVDERGVRVEDGALGGRREDLDRGEAADRVLLLGHLATHARDGDVRVEPRRVRRHVHRQSTLEEVLLPGSAYEVAHLERVGVRDAILRVRDAQRVSEIDDGDRGVHRVEEELVRAQVVELAVGVLGGGPRQVQIGGRKALGRQRGVGRDDVVREPRAEGAGPVARVHPVRLPAPLVAHPAPGGRRADVEPGVAGPVLRVDVVVALGSLDRSLRPVEGPARAEARERPQGLVDREPVLLQDRGDVQVARDTLGRGRALRRRVAGLEPERPAVRARQARRRQRGDGDDPQPERCPAVAIGGGARHSGLNAARRSPRARGAPRRRRTARGSCRS